MKIRRRFISGPLVWPRIVTAYHCKVNTCLTSKRISHIFSILCVCMCTCLHVCTCVHVHEKAKGQPLTSSSAVLHLAVSWGRASHWSWMSQTLQGWLTSESHPAPARVGVTVSPTMPLPGLGLQACTSLFFNSLLRAKVRFNKPLF